MDLDPTAVLLTTIIVLLLIMVFCPNINKSYTGANQEYMVSAPHYYTVYDGMNKLSPGSYPESMNLLWEIEHSDVGDIQMDSRSI